MHLGRSDNTHEQGSGERWFRAKPTSLQIKTRALVKLNDPAL
jgi:hypothetical protein